MEELFVYLMIALFLLIFVFGCHFVGSQVSGTKNAFNNKGKGRQDFTEAEIITGAQNSGSSSQLSGTVNAFNNEGDSQNFKNAKIRTGAQHSGSSSQLSGTQYSPSFFDFIMLIVRFLESKITNRQGEKKD